MHKIMELRDKLMDELEQFAETKITEQNIMLIDTIAHAIKCIDTVVAMEEGSYESRESRESREAYSGRRYREGGSREGYSGRRGGGSSRRRRDSMGRYADGYSNEYSGRYSRDEAKDKLIDEMEGMMGDVSPEAQHAIQKAIRALGQE